MVLACDEYIILDYVKRYYSAGEQIDHKADEDILARIMDIIDQLKAQGEKRSKSDRYDKVFSPAMNAVMVIVFLSIGNKRVRLHKEKIVTLKSDMKKRQDECVDVSGQIKLLEDLKNRIAKERKSQNQPVIVNVNNEDVEYKKQAQAILDIKKSLNQMKALKNDLENNYYNLLKSVSKQLVKPADLK